MKKLIYIFILFGTLCSCKKDKKKDPEIPVVKDNLAINYYQTADTSQSEVPQFTIKNNKVQFTAFSSYEEGANKNIDKIYISDADSKMEWISLVNSKNQPEFLYSINTATNQKIPELYWIEHKSDNKVILRYYEYDWENRLGTLMYEADITNNDVSIIFDNTSNNNLSSSNENRSVNTATRSSGGKTAKSRSFPSPVLAFNNFNTHPSDDLDDDINDFLKKLKDLKELGIKASCKVSTMLNKPDKSLICKLGDLLDNYVNEQLFEDIAKVDEREQASESFDFESDNTNYNVEHFSDLDEIDNTDERHFNTFRDNLPSFNTFREWISNVLVTANTQLADLDDLSDSHGVIQIGLSWNTDNTDIDLHVVDPNGEEIYYHHPTSQSGGYLDRDDVDGFGPENIYWTENIPDGTYSVSVVYFGPEDGPLTDFTIKVINGLGVSKSFTGSLGYFNESGVPVTTFTKIGNQIIFN
ncbi:periplasmic copper-binding protein [Arcticibacter svalbardensis MN12-7]|uniref:Periplasmic copper-binding protein n=1 Tax=Arcticibacter svalbardensis MN12-7 TaxID=1150600 RepID=R9GN00_9SPHI|nr:periplasmic copper-binding protein [Arcticibacter svalbardensis]EOR93098.1 periplasmic copper-binding protein [Arcticibacter svalbardensis MN12-7]